MSIFKPTKISHLEQPMFLGEGVDVSRFDQVKYPWIDKLTDRQLGFFWRPEEVDLTRDAIDFRERLAPHEQHIFISNLKYQTLLDSVQGRAPNIAFGAICSLPELETWIGTWSFSESIHSRSYTHIIRNVFANPTEILDQITLTPEILERAKSVTEDYDLLITMNNQLSLNPDLVNQEDFAKPHRKQVYKTLASVNVLEAVRFYVSFACSFGFAERKLMEGNAKIIKLIARDEALHLSGTQLLLKSMMNGAEGDIWKQTALECQDDVIKLFDDAVEQEKAWAKYLFKDGSVLGLNVEILSEYVEYIANTRLKALGFDQRYNTKTNPLPWMNSYLSNDNVQVAPQETEISSYLSGALDSNVSADDLTGLSL